MYKWGVVTNTDEDKLTNTDDECYYTLTYCKTILVIDSLHGLLRIIHVHHTWKELSGNSSRRNSLWQQVYYIIQLVMPYSDLDVRFYVP